MNNMVVRRFFELAIDVALLIVLSPILVLTGVIVRMKLGKPILFRQERPGNNGKTFTIYKFRTMTDERDEDGQLLPDRERMTRLGQFLRKTSLDELPEFCNVIRGEMSIVGPRPLLMQYLDRYPPEQARRHEVKLGITGWAQVNGRKAITWEQKFEYDIWYVDHQSLWLDLKIIVIVILSILRRDGINQSGQATMKELMGSGRMRDYEA